MFVNIGLQNGVLLRTVLDPLNGQLTDTRTRQVWAPSQLVDFLIPPQVLGDPPHQTHSGPDTKKSCHPCALITVMD